MNDWLSSLLGGLVSISGTIVGKVLATMGIGYASFSALDSAFNTLEQYIYNGFTGLSGTSLQIIQILNVDIALSLVLSAVTVKMALSGIQGGFIKKLIFQ